MPIKNSHALNRAGIRSNAVPTTVHQKLSRNNSTISAGMKQLVFAADLMVTNLVSPPLIVSYGIGVDSTAMLIAMAEKGIRPDLILFADTGGEKPETLAYLSVINAWLAKVGFPAVTVVRYKPKRAPYTSLEQKCLANQTLPSLAFGKHSCSIVFKAEPQNKYLSSWKPALDTWASGQRVLKAIGTTMGNKIVSEGRKQIVPWPRRTQVDIKIRLDMNIGIHYKSGVSIAFSV